MKKHLLPILFIVFALTLQLSAAFAQDDSGEGDVAINLVPHSKDGIFESAASYTFTAKNTYKTPQEGTISYLVTTPTGKPLKRDSIKVKIAPKAEGKYDFKIPSLGTGFYKVNFMINVSEYDDTVRRVFGINAREVKSAYPKPRDFDMFWQNTRAELARVKPEFTMTEYPDSTRDNRKVYLFEMKSLGNLTVRGWVTIPIVKRKSKKFSVLLGLPGYQVSLKPMFGSDPDLAIITLNVRGQGNSRDVINTKRDDYISYKIEDRYQYVMRGAIMDCVRAIDFIYSRPEFDHDNIMVSGGSMGGFLAIATAAIDDRVKLCSAQNPILSDVHNLEGAVDWPIDDIKRYVKSKPRVKYEDVLRNLEYFDTKNFATNIKCPTLIGIGLLDHIVPPANEFAVYNNLEVKKHMIVFRDLGHEVAVEYKNYEGRWMRDAFGLF